MQSGDIKQIIRNLDADRNCVDAKSAPKLISWVLNNVDYTLEPEKKYIWTVLINLCVHHKLPEIHGAAIWRDICSYHEQDCSTQLNSQCLSSLVMFYTNHEHFEKAMEVLRWLDTEYNLHSAANAVVLMDRVYAVLLTKLSKTTPNRNFTTAQCIDAVQYIHLHLMQYNIHNLRLQHCLITAYCRFGQLDKARDIFNAIPIKQTDTFNTMIGCYLHINDSSDNCVHHHSIIELWNGMKRNHIRLDHVSYLLLLQSFKMIEPTSSELNIVQQLRHDLQRDGYGDHPKIVNALILQLSRCGAVDDAQNEFKRVASHSKDYRLYNVMMRCLVENNRFCDALQLYRDMRIMNGIIDEVILMYAIKSCHDSNDDSIKALAEIRQQIANSSHRGNIKLLNAMITQHGKLEDSASALDIFTSILTEKRTFITYSAMMSAFVSDSRYIEAQQLYHEMKTLGMKHNAISYLVALKACFNLIALEAVHRDIIDSAVEETLEIQNYLIYQYARCGDLQKSYNIYRSIDEPRRDVVTYTTMIRAFYEEHCPSDALRIYDEFKASGIEMNELSAITVISCCSIDRENVEMIHWDLKNRGFEQNIKVNSALITAYLKHGDVASAQRIFDIVTNMDDVDSEGTVRIYNAKISGLESIGRSEEALMVYDAMKCKGNLNEEVEMNMVTHILAIKSSKTLERLNEIHTEIASTSYYGMVQIVCALMTQYARHGDNAMVKKMISRIEIKERDRIVCNIMMNAMSQFEGTFDSQILELYREMKNAATPIHRNRYSYKMVLGACGRRRDLVALQEVYADVQQNSNYLNGVGLKNEFIDQFVKCNDIEAASKILESIPKDERKWTPLIPEQSS